MGERVFPTILLIAQEDIKKKTFLDILNRLEELELLDKNNWLKLREVRNQIAHEYSFHEDEVVDNINLVYYKSEELLKTYTTIEDFCKKKLIT